MRRAALLAAVLTTSTLLPACTIERAVSPGITVSPRLAEDCRDHCARLEMRLAAVVVAANAGGCVCEPEPTAPTPATPRASRASGSAATLLMLAQAQAAEEQRKKDQAASTSTTSSTAGAVRH